MLVDANILLYAVDSSSAFHRPAGLAVYSADTDFARFTELKWVNPISLPA